jgi:ATP synthase protein I
VPKFTGLREVFGEGEGHLLAQASAVGLAFAVAIVLGLALGWWLDRKFGTAPACLLAGLFVGIAAGFKNLFTLSARLDREAKKAAERKKYRIPPERRKSEDA